MLRPRHLKRTLVYLTLTALLLAAVPAALAQNGGNAARAITWLVTNHQNEDGGYSSFSAGSGEAPSDISGTLDALLAIAATGRIPVATTAYVEDNVDALAEFAQTGGGEAGKALLALTAIGADPADYNGFDFVGFVTEQAGDSGQLASTPYNHALAMLSLISAETDVPADAISWLSEQQASNGSWDDGFGTSDNTDATAMAIMALNAVGADDSVDAAVGFLQNAQLDDGAWEYGAGFGGNANSTGLAIQALQAVGVDASSAVAAMAAFQGETGAFQTDLGSGLEDNFYATAQALPAVAGAIYPFNIDLAPEPEVVEPELVDEEVPAVDPTAEAEALIEDITDQLEAETAIEPIDTSVNDTPFWIALVGLLLLGAAVVGAGVSAARPRQISE